MDEFNRLRGKNMNRKQYQKILDTFIPSTEMRDYLATRELSDRKIADIILGAPVPLKTKLQYAIGEDYEELKQAIDELNLNSNELFYLIDNWYDEDIYDENSYGNAPFSSLEKVIKHIREEIDECGEELGRFWYTLEKWVLDENGNYICTYRYILIEDKVCFFKRNEILINVLTCSNDYRFFRSTDLNLPVPFKAGDIVNIDCRPFAPVQQVKITETGDNHDYSSLQAEFYDKKEKKYKTGAVKRCFIFDNGYRPLLSPLYRISTV